MTCALLTAAGAAARDGGAAAAPDDPPPTEIAPIAPHDTGRDELTIKGGVWFPRLGGASSLGGGVLDIDLEVDLSLGATESTPNIELSYVTDAGLKLHFDGFKYEGASTLSFAGAPSTFGAISLQPGDQVRAEVGITSIGAELWIPLTKRYEDDREVDLRVSTIAGLRVTHTRQVVEEIDVEREERTLDTPAPMIGAGIDIAWKIRERTPFVHRLDLSVSTSIGPALSGDGNSVWQLRADATLSITPNIGVVFGYRLLELDLESDDYRFDGGLQGLFVGAMLRF